MRFLIGKLYMETCPHCVELEPVWKLMKDRIDQNAKNHPKVEIIYIEEEANGMDEKLKKYHQNYFNGESKIQVPKGYPTLFFGIPEKKVDYYEGDRSLDALENWYMNKMGIQKVKENPTLINKLPSVPISTEEEDDLFDSYPPPPPPSPIHSVFPNSVSFSSVKHKKTKKRKQPKRKKSMKNKNKNTKRKRRTRRNKNKNNALSSLSSPVL